MDLVRIFFQKGFYVRKSMFLKTKTCFAGMFYFSQEKMKFRGRNGATNQEVNVFMVMEHL